MPLLHQNGRDRAAALVQLGFEHRSHGRTRRIGLQILQVGNQQNHFEQQIEVLSWLFAETGTMTVSPPQSSASRPRSASCCLTRSGCASGLSILLIATTIGTLGGFGVVDGFERLRHHAVIGRDYQHDDVGDFGAARAHARERFVARRIDEHDLAAVLLDVISADVLRDAAGFAAGHIGFANGVEQRSLAVIDVAHDGDHGSAPHAILGLFGLLEFLRGFFFVADLVGGSSEIARQFFGQL